MNRRGSERDRLIMQDHKKGTSLVSFVVPTAIEETEGLHEFLLLLNQVGWSQTEAARELKVTSSHINMILKRRTRPSQLLLELLRIKARRHQPQESTDSRISGLLQKLRSLDPDIRKEVIRSIRTILDAIPDHPAQS